MNTIASVFLATSSARGTTSDASNSVRYIKTSGEALPHWIWYSDGTANKAGGEESLGLDSDEVACERSNIRHPSQYENCMCRLLEGGRIAADL